MSKRTIGRTRWTGKGWTKAFREDRGDVPGWVLITIMTAALVAALLAVAQDKLVVLFNQAMDSLT